MIDRCTNIESTYYKNYGGRGITICDNWRTFQNFYADMSLTYKKGLTLDRINNDSNYSVENCRWATRKEQANNTRNIEKAIKITYKGITDSIANWAKFFNIKRTTLDMRIRKYKWPIERAFMKGVS